MRDPRIAGICFLLAIQLMWTVESGLSQVSPNQIPVQNLRTQSVVSKNQLLTQEKAVRETDRAREDLLKGKYESARKEVQRALAISPNCALAHHLQGVIGLVDGDYAEAVHAFQQSIDEDPTLGSAYLGLGTALVARGHFREALIPLDRATALVPDTWDAYYETALARLGLGEPLTSLREIAQGERFAAADAKKMSGVAILRGEAYLQLKDISAAKKFLQEAVRRDPHGTYAVLAKRKLERLDALTAISRR